MITPLTPEQQAIYNASLAKNGWTDPTPLANRAPSLPSTSTPSYSNLTSNGNTPSAAAPASSPTFTSSLIQMLRDAQNRDSAGQAGLMKQSQDITGQGIKDAQTNFNNPMLTPSAGTSLGMAAQNEFDPSLLSIANQQKLASNNLGNITDLLKQTGTDYKDEQDRILQAARDAEDVRHNKASEANTKASGSSTFKTAAQIPEFTKNFESIKSAPYMHADGTIRSDNDQYVDPQEWIAARTLWGIRGGSDASFVSNFKKYLNPESYDKAGIGTGGGA